MTIVPPHRVRPIPTDFEIFRNNNPEFAACLPGLRRYREKVFSNLQQLQGRKRRSKVRSILSDRRLGKLYAYEALRKCRRLSDANTDAIDELIRDANLFKPCREHHFTKTVRSRSRRREVLVFGAQKRLRQMLVADLIHTIHPPLASQYLYRGGMPAARRAVDAAYFNRGFSHCVEIDFVNFYGSVPREGLADVLKPLPSAVVRHVVYDTTIRREGHGDEYPSISPLSWSDPHRIGPSGLPLGSACSPVVGECILAQFLREIPSDRYVAYADNILVFGSSADDVEALIDSLRRRMQAAIGPMRYRPGQIFRTGSTTPMRQGFCFLGQTAVVPEQPSNGSQNCSGFRWSPSAEKQMEYQVTELDARLSNTELDQAEQKVINWRMAYPQWRDGEEFEAQRLAEIASLRYFRSASMIDKRRACDAVVSAALSCQLRYSAHFIVPENNDRSNDRMRNSLVQMSEDRLAKISLSRSQRA